MAAKFNDLDLLAEFCGSVLVVSGFLFLILKAKFVSREEFQQTAEISADKVEQVSHNLQDSKMLIIRQEETQKAVKQDIVELKQLYKEYVKIAHDMKEAVAQLRVQVEIKSKRNT